MQSQNPTQGKFNGIAVAKVWKKTRRKDGAEYFQSQRMGNARYLLLPNPKAGEEGEGDFTLFVVPVDDAPKPSG